MKKREKGMKKQNDVELFSSYLRCVIRSMHAHGRKVLLKQNLTFPQYYTLFLLSKKDNCCMDFLKNDLKTSGAVATKVVDHLVRKKLVDRGFWSKDRRKVNIVLTDKGEKLLESIEKVRMKFMSKFLGKMNETNKKKAIAGLKILSDVLSIEEGK